MPTRRPASTEFLALAQTARDDLWRMGNLLWKLHSDQRSVLSVMLAAFAAGSARFVLEIARRWGKSRLLVVLAVQTCVKKPKCRVVYGAQTLKDLQEFIIPHFEAVTEDAPPGLRWRFEKSRMHWKCENGAYVQLFGCDDKRKANRGRGSGAELVILDECGFIKILKYVMRNIVGPQLLHSKGKLLLASTPAEEPDHDFTEVAALAESNGNYARRTIHDNPLLTPEDIAAFVARDAQDEGYQTPEEYMASDDFLREHMALRVVNKLLVAVPEWESMRSKLMRPVERPEFFDGMTILDPGGRDPHGVIFGYWHFEMAKFIQEDELLLRDGENSLVLSERIKEKERELWGVNTWDGTLRAARDNPNGALAQTVPEWMLDILTRDAQPQPYHRVMDINLVLARDLYDLHQMAFLNTAKDNKQEAVNNLRVAMRREEYLLHPRCVHTDRHFKQTTWKDGKRREYARKGGEHGDLLDCSTYGLRNVDKQRNPFPIGWNQPVHANPLQARIAAEAQAEAARSFFGNSRLAHRLGKRGAR